MTVSLGCVHGDVPSEPGSWIVVGMIPIFDKKKATRPNLRIEDGPQGAARRLIEITHQCLGALLEGWNARKASKSFSGRTVFGVNLESSCKPSSRTSLRQTPIFATMSCKLCHCPKDRLNVPAEHAPKYAHSQEVKILSGC
jgi:hypothetical protein